jgi:hypothetical protein
MIINIRGTHGSGKSTIVKQIMDRYNATAIIAEGSRKPEGYMMESCAGQLFVVGPYETACGGCDAIQPYSLIWPRVVDYAQRGHVLFEGALVSSSYGNIGRDSEVYGTQFVFAFLDTPLEVCLDRIRKRREAKGNMKPLDPKNTKYKYDNIAKSLPKIRDEFKRRVVILDHRKPVPQLLGLLLNG